MHYRITLLDDRENISKEVINFKEEHVSTNIYFCASEIKELKLVNTFIRLGGFDQSTIHWFGLSKKERSISFYGVLYPQNS